ncbi:STAS domain-containing protein [Methylocella sp.]|uniref:STAS domain-containing protein n=1 Tax=Methylocella sp. TaxID=1978226 RepID=UPI003784D23A
MTPDMRAPTRAMELAPVLDVMAGAPLAARLRACSGANVTIDGSRVERLGGQCLQILLAAAASFRAHGARLRLVDPSPAMLDDLALFGVGRADLESGGD